MIRKTSIKTLLACDSSLRAARFGVAVHWPTRVSVSLTIREQFSRKAVLRHRLLRHQGLQVRRLILGFSSQDQNFLLHGAGLVPHAPSKLLHPLNSLAILSLYYPIQPVSWLSPIISGQSGRGPKHKSNDSLLVHRLARLSNV